MLPPEPIPKPVCLPCSRGRCVSCLWRTRPNGCSCCCPWLVADLLEHFPSLREQYLQGGTDD